ncbi:MAG: hypothetical protein AABX61_01780 [Nanoarchaeota archaeon]
MPKPLVVDSSTLFALGRVKLIKFLGKIDFKIFIPKAVKEEIQKGNDNLILKLVKMTELKGRTLKISKQLEKLNLDKGESQCCALAFKLKLKFIICDDRRFIRQIFFSNNNKLKKIKILGFSFFLHEFYKNKLIDDVWKHFNEIIKVNNWERSEVQVANYTFLKELGY